eukprot:10271159-Lingulodinium_polyedra.AAC.1
MAARRPVARSREGSNWYGCREALCAMVVFVFVPSRSLAARGAGGGHVPRWICASRRMWAIPSGPAAA